ncbi:MAG: Holliday junction resolvase RuvX [Leptolyngbya sp. ERB_1_1]
MERVAALGLDVGQKRIGVAGCDGTGLIATGLTTITRKSYPQTIEALRQIVHDRAVEILVIGLPYSMDGSIGTQARHIQKFAETISKALSLPIEYVDERLTSYQAEQFLQAEGISLQHNKGLIDRKAAALILQQWLDERRAKRDLERMTNASEQTH